MIWQYVWIGANVINIVALITIIAIFYHRRQRALLMLPTSEVYPASVTAQRALNADAALFDMVWNGLLLFLGVVMLVSGIAWDLFTDEPVPVIIPIGTVIFSIIYLGKAGTRLWEARRREYIQALAIVEAKTLKARGRE